MSCPVQSDKGILDLENYTVKFNDKTLLVSSSSFELLESGHLKDGDTVVFINVKQLQSPYYVEGVYDHSDGDYCVIICPICKNHN